MPEPIELDSTYVFLHDGGTAQTLASAEFWQTIAERRDLDHGWLVTRGISREDWPHWEMHPEGEEIVTMISGHVTLVLDDGTRTWEVELRSGQTWINPRGAWHRAIVHEPSDMLFMTADHGTQHRPIEARSSP